jgi:hypothetical protein
MPATCTVPRIVSDLSLSASSAAAINASDLFVDVFCADVHVELSDHADQASILPLNRTADTLAWLLCEV